MNVLQDSGSNKFKSLGTFRLIGQLLNAVGRCDDYYLADCFQNRSNATCLHLILSFLHVNPTASTLLETPLLFSLTNSYFYALLRAVHVKNAHFTLYIGTRMHCYNVSRGN